jgi:hypothetical protein
MQWRASSLARAETSATVESFPRLPPFKPELRAVNTEREDYAYNRTR